MGDTLRDVPELFETALGESLVARTDQIPQFRLGPPDLCHLVKNNAKTAKDVTSYHYVSGVEASSAGSLAAYINTLTYSMDDSANKGGWFSAPAPFRIKSGVYCCYNAFAMLDVRVEVRIPGGVNVYAVNRAGKRVAIGQDASPAFWAELFVSSVLRATLADANPDLYPAGPAGLRRLDPLPDLNVEGRFLDAVKDVFPRAWQLGADPDVQVPTLTSNVLVYALVRYFGFESGRWDVLIRLWRDLLHMDPSLAALLAQAYMNADLDGKAVKLLYQTLQVHPNCTPVLLAQIDLLQKKGKQDLALTLAKRLVNTAPLEFKAWEKLTQCYTQQGDWPMALLALNSCPMFANSSRELPVMPEPLRVHFPDFADPNGLYSDNDTHALTPLRAEGLRGTFRKAYALLADMVDHAGWEDLLAHRANVFVMEDEYRQVKEEELMPNAAGKTDGASDGDDVPLVVAATGKPASAPSAAPVVPAATDEAALAEPSVDPVANTEPTAATEEPAEDDENADPEALPPSWRARARAIGGSKLLTAFSHKRLCERWLDDLFLMLYEDLRVYTAWKAEEAHAREYQLAYKRTCAEWEYLGDLARRLGKKADARNAYRQCTVMRFSPKASLRLLALLTEPDAVDDDVPIPTPVGPDGTPIEDTVPTTPGDATSRVIGETLRHVARLLSIPGHNVAILHKVYGDRVYPNPLASAMFKLINRYGLARVQAEVMARKFPTPIFKRMSVTLEYAEKFRVRGWDA
ncbi:hypothetical protein GGF31_007093 [Allomyces arbusculus]|nr:hypothetical protein GGF31_007093 [Allomyces arbusculus]